MPTTTRRKKTLSAKAEKNREEEEADFTPDFNDQPYPPYNAYPQAQQPAQTNNLLVILLIVLAFFAGYLFFKVKNLEKNPTVANAAAGAGVQQQPQAQQPAAPTTLNIKKPDPGVDHWKGNKNARYILVEYSDFECPFCKQFHPSAQKFLQDGGDNVAWVFRQYPLPFHPKAQKSAEGSECVTDLGGNDAFWKYADMVFDKMPDLELTGLGDVASAIGVDQSAFQQCVDSGKNAQKVKDSSAEGTKEGVQATPTNVFYDMQSGKTLLIEGAVPYDQLKSSFDSFVAQNK